MINLDTKLTQAQVQTFREKYVEAELDNLLNFNRKEDVLDLMNTTDEEVLINILLSDIVYVATVGCLLEGWDREYIDLLEVSEEDENRLIKAVDLRFNAN